MIIKDIVSEKGCLQTTYNWTQQPSRYVLFSNLNSLILTEHFWRFLFAFIIPFPGVCNTVDCSYSEWNDWSTQCGAGERTRTTVTTPKTVERLEGCKGLQTTCPDNVQKESRNELCKYKENELIEKKSGHVLTTKLWWK